jgi:hypothetical protein
VVSWGQTAIDGQAPFGQPALALHRSWTWTGDPVRIAEGGARMDPGEYEEACARAAAQTRLVLSRALVAEHVRADEDADHGRDFIFQVTDGIRFWTLTLLEFDELPQPLIMFTGEAPPPDRRLIISEALKPLLQREPQVEPQRGAVCFTPGTMIETEAGPRPVEDIVAGDRVMTRDNGAQDVLWVGSKLITGARLHAFPDLRPVCIREGAIGEGRPEDDLIVSPDHRVLLSGKTARVLFGEPEVLVAARDLIDDRGITRAHDLREVTYVHLLLQRHEILQANGVFAESFHPGDADLDMVPTAQRQRLFDLMPGLASDADAYGPRVRRVIGTFEAAALIPCH